MEHLFEHNGLIFWSEQEIQLREMFTKIFARGIKEILKEENRAWEFVQIEAPLLTPTELLSASYTDEDRWGFDRAGLSLRPETTPGSYAYLQHLLNTHTRHKPPFCVWQVGKSFRREQDQPYKYMRLKEFYQQEFQCLYTADTLNDYHSAVLKPVAALLATTIGLPFRIVKSDRLPSYSQITVDVEIKLPGDDYWMEICSISRRTDFPDKLRFSTKKGVVEKDPLVLEIAIGLDRCVYNYMRRIETEDDEEI